MRKRGRDDLVGREGVGRGMGGEELILSREGEVRRLRRGELRGYVWYSVGMGLMGR